ncbi:MAG: electron transfer flavoprotein subunit beta/FixA family protein [Flavobacteriales bacterium]|nr:electron transfer flavoprotein subunit beta/FixA family protein [Bacteroidota bacterium]MCB9239617.1 electron transfer flavoprotein subunit beta/FixA family protein [Flavobacteriales bacterium]
MNILVCVSPVPDTTTKITFADNNTKFNTNGVQFIINPYDELALTRALEITEAQGGEVTVITVGTAGTEPIIRKALAIGAHNAIRVNLDPVDAMQVAKAIQVAVADKSFDLILTGRESIDHNGGLVAGLLAELMGMNLINVVTKIDVDGTTVTAVRDIDGGRETVSCELPAVLSAQKDLCEPRIPNMRGIMQARTKPLQVVEYSESATGTSVSSFELPPAKEGVKLIDAANAGELIDLLRTEKKLI